MLATALLLVATSFERIETLPSSPYDIVIGSPVGHNFYLIFPDANLIKVVDHKNLPEQSDAGNYSSKPGFRILKKYFYHPSETIDTDFNGALLGTDSEGRPIFQTQFINTRTVEGFNPGPELFPAPDFTLDSGVRIDRHGDFNVTLTGPRRKSPIPSRSTEDLRMPSVAVFTNQPLFISCDGIDHLITASDKPGDPDAPYTLTLYRWGDEINTLILIKTMDLPRSQGDKKFHIYAIASAHKGECYVVYDSWLKSQQGHESKAERSVLYIDIETGDRQVVYSQTIPKPSITSDGVYVAGWCAIRTVTLGKYLAFQDHQKIIFFKRNGS